MIIGILILAIIGLITLFSVQNEIPVSVSVLSWRFDTTLPLLVSIAVLLGIVFEQLVRKWMVRRSAKAKNPQDIP